MAASAPLFSSCSPRIICRRNTNSVNHHNPPSSSSSSCSPSPYSSYSNFSSHRSGHYWNFITFSGSLLLFSLSLSLSLALSHTNTIMCLKSCLVFWWKRFCCHNFHYFVNLQAMELWNFWSFVIGVLVFYCLKVIWKHQSVKAQAMSTTQGDLSSPTAMINLEDKPDHLLVLVHGIMGSPSDWTYCEAELKRRLGRNFLIYASSCNMYTKTFTGIDGSGKRLAEEVMEVVKKADSLKKISFLAHSLGGLIARYAIAVLYTPNVFSDYSADTATNSKSSSSSYGGLIAGLEAVHFITLATPHLGVRGKKQLPFLLGLSFLEKIAPPIAPIFTGHTGSQLFLTDGEADKPPLLLRMASDCDEGKFLSALGAFRYRILYANVSYDHMVGWRTSSIRREKELVTPTNGSLDGYEHIVNVENCPPVLSESPNFPSEAAEAKEAAQNDPSAQNTAEYHEIMEEEMIRGLQRLGWTKVDVSFHSVLWPFFAHYNIQVKNERFHNAGAGVVAHVADTIKQQDSSPYVSISSRTLTT